MDGLIVILGLVRGAAERHRHLRGLIVRGIETEIGIVEFLALGAAAVQRLTGGKTEHIVPRRASPLLVEAGEALGEIAFDRIDVAAERGFGLGVAFGLPDLKDALSKFEYRIQRILRLGIKGQHFMVRLHGIGPARLTIGGIGGLELHLADIVDLRGGDVRLDVLLEHVLDEFLDLLSQFAGGRRPCRFGVLDEHVDRMVERTCAIALPAFLDAK